MSGRIADLIDAVRARETATLAAIAALEVARARLDYAESEERQAHRDLAAAYAQELEQVMHRLKEAKV